MSHSVGVQSQKASGSPHDRREQNMQNNNKMGGAHDLIRKPIRSENCSSDQHQRRGEPPLRADPRPPDQCQQLPLRAGQQSDEPHQHQHGKPPLRAVYLPDQHHGEPYPPGQHQHHGEPLSRAVHPPDQQHGEPHPPGQRQHHGEPPLRAVHHPDQQHGESHQCQQPPLRAGQHHDEPHQHQHQGERGVHQHHGESHQHQHQGQPLRAVHPSDQQTASDQHQQRSGHDNKHPLSAPQIPVQGNSEAQLRQTQGRSGPQYHQSSTSRENIVTPPTFPSRQHSEQRNDSQHTDQRERHSDQYTDQRYQHTDHRERYSDQHTDQREHYSDQHTEQCTGQRDQYDQHTDQRDQHTDQSKYTRPLSKAESIPSNASNEGRRAIPPQSTGQPLPSKPVGNPRPQGDNPEKKELSDTGPRSVDVETSISGLNDLENPPTSLSPEPYTENPLVTDVDTEIKEMAAEVREEVKSRDFVATGLHEKPFDPNLVCPMCGKKHHIGDIQKFRIHVNQCDGVAV